MEVRRYVADCEGLDLSGCIWVCLCGHTIYLSEGREGDERERKLCMVMKIMNTTATPHCLAGWSFPTDTKTASCFFFYFSSCVLFTNREVTSVLKISLTPECSIFCFALESEGQSISDLNLVIYWFLFDLLKGQEKWPEPGVKTLQMRISKNFRKTSGMRDIYLRLIVAFEDCKLHIQSMVDNENH